MGGLCTRRVPVVCRLVLSLTVFAGVCTETVRAQLTLEALAARVGVRILSEGSSDSTVRDQTVRQIPVSRMTALNSQRVRNQLSHCAQYRRMPSLQYVVDPEMYRYLLNHPDVAVSSWRALGISRFQMWQTGPGEYEAEAGDGSEGIADIVFSDPQQVILFVEGTYNSPLLPRSIDASVLVWLRYKFVRATDGSTLVTQHTDAFVAFPSATMQTVAKIASPVTNVIMDRNALEVSLYARMISKAVQAEPEWVIALADRLDGVLPARPAELKQLAHKRRPAVSRVQSLSAAGSGHLDNSEEFRVFETSLSRVQEQVSIPSVGPLPPELASKAQADAAARPSVIRRSPEIASAQTSAAGNSAPSGPPTRTASVTRSVSGLPPAAPEAGAGAAAASPLKTQSENVPGSPAAVAGMTDSSGDTAADAAAASAPNSQSAEDLFRLQTDILPPVSKQN